MEAACFNPNKTRSPGRALPENDNVQDKCEGIQDKGDNGPYNAYGPHPPPSRVIRRVISQEMERRNQPEASENNHGNGYPQMPYPRHGQKGACDAYDCVQSNQRRNVSGGSLPFAADTINQLQIFNDYNETVDALDSPVQLGEGKESIHRRHAPVYCGINCSGKAFQT